MAVLTQIALPRTRETVQLQGDLAANPYLEHQVLWDMGPYGPTDKRDFLYRLDDTEAGLLIHVLASKAFTPERPWQARSREFSPAYRPGQLLSFDLRVSPTEDKCAGKGSKNSRVDMVMSRYIEADGKTPVSQISTMVANQWMQRRAEAAGFRLVEAHGERYRTVTAFKRGRALNKVPLLDIKGVLEVVDPAKFFERQKRGYGHAQFLGAGLMLVKPVR